MLSIVPVVQLVPKCLLNDKKRGSKNKKMKKEGKIQIWEEREEKRDRRKVKNIKKEGEEEGMKKEGKKEKERKKGKGTEEGKSGSEGQRKRNC